MLGMLVTHTVACVYWKIPGLNNKRHSERNPEGRTGVSGDEYLKRETERENYRHHVLVIKTKQQNSCYMSTFTVG